MYISRRNPPIPYTPQLGIEADLNSGASGPAWAMVLITIVVFTIGIACELISPGALTYIAILQ